MEPDVNPADLLLTELYAAGAPMLDDRPWTFEGDRWVEMLVCVLVVDLEMDTAEARDAVDLLRSLDAIAPEALARANPELAEFIVQVLAQRGFSMEAACQASIRFTSLAQVIQKRWNGYLQKLLRSHGEKMARELGEALGEAGLDPDESAKISVLWLQNVANLPILLPNDSHISGFCKTHSLSDPALLDTADRLGLNVAVLDDLLALDAAVGENSDAS
jgi:hypothetical protein